jgi:hypothetical protein
MQKNSLMKSLARDVQSMRPVQQESTGTPLIPYNTGRSYHKKSFSGSNLYQLPSEKSPARIPGRPNSNANTQPRATTSQTRKDDLSIRGLKSAQSCKKNPEKFPLRRNDSQNQFLNRSNLDLYKAKSFYISTSTPQSSHEYHKGRGNLSKGRKELFNRESSNSYGSSLKTSLKFNFTKKSQTSDNFFKVGQKKTEDKSLNLASRDCRNFATEDNQFSEFNRD